MAGYFFVAGTNCYFPRSAWPCIRGVKARSMLYEALRWYEHCLGPSKASFLLGYTGKRDYRRDCFSCCPVRTADVSDLKFASECSSSAHACPLDKSQIATRESPPRQQSWKWIGRQSWKWIGGFPFGLNKTPPAPSSFPRIFLDSAVRRQGLCRAPCRRCSEASMSCWGS